MLEMVRAITRTMSSKVFAGALDSITFENAWKNAGWHVNEPASLDLANRDGIMAKTHRWLGHPVQDGVTDPVKVHFILGAPQDPAREPATTGHWRYSARRRSGQRCWRKATWTPWCPESRTRSGRTRTLAAASTDDGRQARACRLRRVFSQMRALADGSMAKKPQGQHRKRRANSAP